MKTTYNLPESINEDLDRFRDKVADVENGTVSAAEFRTFRVPQGVYEQREDGMYMLRIRLPGGALLPHQMKKLADVARGYGNGLLHVTSRQDIQVHNVALSEIHPALVELAANGMSTKGGGGNTVRNVTACYDAGVCPKESFDVTPYAVAVTEFLLPDPVNYQLPRKYKIAFSGCSKDCTGATVNDLGCIAKERDGVRGFTVYVGGGMGKMSRTSQLLEEFVPADQIHYIAEAVKRVFDRNGNRKNKHKARLRFLINKIGFDEFRRLYEEALTEVMNENIPLLDVRDLSGQVRDGSAVSPADTKPADGFELWRTGSVSPQKQKDYYIVIVPLDLGDITADTLERLAVLAEEYGDGIVRTNQSQNFVMRWVHETELTSLYAKLNSLGLAPALNPVERDIVACAGASMCRLGICLSRGLAKAVTKKIRDAGIEFDGLDEFKLNISGCPNSCGRHPLGQIGLFGAARRVGDRMAPHYVVQIGGRLQEGKTRLAEGKDSVPAHDVPTLVTEFLNAFRNSAEYPDYDAFVDADGRDIVKTLVAQHKHVPSFEEDKNYYFDWGSDATFSLAGRGPGECSAGVFDLIEVDLTSAHDSLTAGRLSNATALAARALLVTQGLEAKTDTDAIKLFRKHFVDAGLVDASYGTLLDAAVKSFGTPEPESALAEIANPKTVAGFVETVKNLYANMDQSLRFKPSELLKEKPKVEEPEHVAIVPDREVDFRGVVCPLNYVKTKLTLDQMNSGQVLSILLDEQGGKNVPQSAAQDGHTVISADRQGDHWLVLLRKA